MKIDEKQKTLQTHIICTQIKQDVDDFPLEFTSADIKSPIDTKSNELCEPEIDLVVHPMLSTDGLEFIAVELKADVISIDHGSTPSPIPSYTDEGNYDYCVGTNLFYDN